MALSKYKDILGVPLLGIHSYRIYNIAVVDVGLTILLASGISFYGNLPFVYTLIFLVILGILLHRLFSVRTTIDKLLFQGNVTDK